MKGLEFATDNRIVIQKVGLVILFFGLCLFGVFLSIKAGIGAGLAIYMLPLLVVFFIACIRSAFFTFIVLFISCFFVLGVARYVTLPVAPGLVIDFLLLFNFLILLFHFMWDDPSKIGTLYLNPVLILSFLWMIYCIMQIINPMTTVSNWSTTVRNIGVHIALFQVLVFFVMNDLKRINIFLVVWGVLVVLATIKAIGQQYLGFDYAENQWLRDFGGKTHIIHSGIRYFSFYTDAANFGCNMGLSMVIFLILGLGEKNSSRRIFYFIVVMLSVYSFMISGTRAAMAVPFVGFAAWIVLVKEWKWIITGVSLLVLIFVVFAFTSIGDSNANIRRMRTAFNATEDASFNVRMVNQQRMRTFMNSHPFGIGMGEAKNAKENDLMFGLATDSSMVFIWVETGIVGLVFYLIIFLTVLLYGTYYVWLVLKNREVVVLTIACVAGLSGMIVAGYANEVLHQMPTGQTVYTLMGIIMISPYLDKKISDAEAKS